MTTALTPAAQFRGILERQAVQALDTLDPEDRDKAVARFMVAFREAVASSRDPNKLYAAALHPVGKASIARAVYLSASTGLYPGGALPDVYLIPRKIQNVPSIVWMPSWRGLKRSVERNGARIQSVLVYDGEPFEVIQTDAGTSIEHYPSPFVPKSWDTLRGGFVRANFQDGTSAAEFMGKHDIEARRAKSDSFRSKYPGPWDEWPLEMARKTLLLYAVRRGLVPADPQLNALVKSGEQDAIDVDSQPVTRRQLGTGARALGVAMGMDVDDGLDLEEQPEVSDE